MVIWIFYITSNTDPKFQGRSESRAGGICPFCPNYNVALNLSYLKSVGFFWPTGAKYFDISTFTHLKQPISFMNHFKIVKAGKKHELCS